MNANYWWRMELDFAANILRRCGNDFWKKEWYKRRGFFIKKNYILLFLFLLSLLFIYKLYMKFELKLLTNFNSFIDVTFLFWDFIFYYIEELDIWTQYLNVPKKRKILSPFVLKTLNTFLGPQGHGEWCLCLCI